MVAGSQSSSPSSALRVAIVDYGMGNVRSVQGALERLGCSAAISSDPEVLRRAEALVLPGVGAFGEAMENLTTRRLRPVLDELVLRRRTPILGICLGMQLFADSSEEMGHHDGLGWVPGRVELVPAREKGLPLPHVGWNEISFGAGDPLLTRLAPGVHFYFDHSYHYRCEDRFIVARAQYANDLVAAVRRDHVIGVQFHPEKSQVAGLKLLRNFLNLAIGLVRGSQAEARPC